MILQRAQPLLRNDHWRLCYDIAACTAVATQRSLDRRIYRLGKHFPAATASNATIEELRFLSDPSLNVIRKGEG
jgi:hypothetical protein